MAVKKTSAEARAVNVQKGTLSRCKNPATMTKIPLVEAQPCESQELANYNVPAAWISPDPQYSGRGGGDLQHWQPPGSLTGVYLIAYTKQNWVNGNFMSITEIRPFYRT